MKFAVGSLFLLSASNAFIIPLSTNKALSTKPTFSSVRPTSSLNLFDGFFKTLKENIPGGDTITSEATVTSTKTKFAMELIQELVRDDKCFSNAEGANKFADVCAMDVVYEDCFEPQPFTGRDKVRQHMLSKVESRKGKGELRLDRVSDGSKACGFAWTYVTENEEGLRGTTFVELNEQGEIKYVREIPEPIYKPGDLTVQLLEAVTKGAEPKPPVDYEIRTPETASEIAKYLFQDVQGSSIDESMRFFDEGIEYRDFNYEDLLNGKEEVRKFIEDFSFPGITFRQQKICDGELSTCFTWEVVLEGAEDTIKGISLYEINPETRKVSYVRYVPITISHFFKNDSPFHVMISHSSQIYLLFK